jgi:hypothetical protein
MINYLLNVNWNSNHIKLRGVLINLVKIKKICKVLIAGSDKIGNKTLCKFGAIYIVFSKNTQNSCKDKSVDMHI